MELAGVGVAIKYRPATSRAEPPTVSKRQLRFQFYLIFLAMDSAAVFVGFLLANFDHTASLGLGLLNTTGAILLVFITLTSAGYRPELLQNWANAARHALTGLVVASAVVLLLCLALRAPIQMSGLTTITGLGIGGAMMLVGHMLVGRLAMTAFNGSPIHLALITDEVAFRSTRPDVRVLSATQLGLSTEVSYPILLDRIARALDGVDRVYVACPPERRKLWAAVLRGSEIPATVLMPELETFGMVACDHFDGIARMVIETGAMGTRDRIIKRALDIAIVLPLLLFFAPLLCFVSVLVKLDSPGPVLFVQQRVGRGNRLFNVYKFRSMYQLACDSAGRLSTVRGDSRITRIGGFIRRTSIDELPQLLNVLKGEMSFVGPRPHALGSLAGDQLFWQVDQRYCDRHVCKPGLTGLAQVRGFRGATHEREDLINRLQADLEYIHDWNVWRDISILFATFKVLFHKNAF